MTALTIAIDKNYVAAIEYLVSKCKSLNNRELLDNTPFKNAIKNYKSDEYETLKLLLEHGADINLMTNGTTPLIYALKFNDISLIKFLLENNAYLNDAWITSIKYGCDDQIVDLLAHFHIRLAKSGVLQVM